MEKVTEADPEVKLKVCAITKAVEPEDAEHDPMEKLVDHFSNRHALLRGLLGFFKFIIASERKRSHLSRRLDAEDLTEAERLVIEG